MLVIGLLLWLAWGMIVFFWSEFGPKEDQEAAPERVEHQPDLACSHLQRQIDDATGLYEEASAAIDRLPLTEQERQSAKQSAKRRYLTVIRDLVGDRGDR